MPKDISNLKSGTIIKITKADHRIHRSIGYHIQGSYCEVSGLLKDGSELLVTPLESQNNPVLLPVSQCSILWDYEIDEFGESD